MVRCKKINPKCREICPRLILFPYAFRLQNSKQVTNSEKFLIQGNDLQSIYHDIALGIIIFKRNFIGLSFQEIKRT